MDIRLNYKTNEFLIASTNEWFESNYKQLINDSKPILISNPFIYGEPYIDENAKKIMIVGQEPKDYNIYNPQINLQDEQMWTIDYLERQVYGIKNGKKYNRSAFWSLQRLLYENGFCTTWNNLDKAHIVDANGKTKPLSLEFEKILGRPLKTDNKTILQREILISKPSAVLFLTGPYYFESMATSLQCEKECIYLKKPKAQKIINNITDEANLNIPCLWTYHPKYLRRAGKENMLFYEVLNKLKEVLT